MGTIFSKGQWNNIGFYYLNWLMTMFFISNSYMALIEYGLSVSSLEVFMLATLRQLQVERHDNGVGRGVESHMKKGKRW